MTPSIRVVIADDHETVREGLKALLATVPDVDVISEVQDGAQAVAAVRGLAPDLIIMDLSMPSDGLTAIQRVKQQRPATAVVVLTRHRDAAYVREALAAGAAGYMLKQSPFSELLAAIRSVMRGERVVDRNLPALDDTPPARALTGVQRELSKRESAVLRLAAQGSANKDIAVACGISVKTVEVHKANAMRKLQLEDRGDLLRYALLQGWL